MGKKLERYIDYIVTNLVKDSEIDYENESYTFPFGIRMAKRFTHQDMKIAFAYIFLSLRDSPERSFFVKYIAAKYGAKQEEAEKIFKLYVDEMYRLEKEYNG
jgi:hypothetical protein